MVINVNVQYGGPPFAPIATRVYFFLFLLFLWRCRFFRVFFGTIAVFSSYVENTPYVISFRMVFFCLVTTGLIIDITLCKNSYIKNSITVVFSPNLYC